MMNSMISHNARFFRSHFIDNSMVYPKSKSDTTLQDDFKEGTVKFYSSAKGFGFIERPCEDDLFFHASQFRFVEFDRENFSLQYGENQFETKMVEIVNRPRRSRYVDDLYYYSDLYDPIFEEQTDPPSSRNPATIMLPKFVKKLPQTPQTGMKILYVAGQNKGKIQAVSWMFFVDLPKMRDELEMLHRAHLESVAAMPMYRLDQILLIKGPPVANNKKRCFECSIAEDRHTLFTGNNRPVMLEQYRETKLNERNIKHEVRYELFVKINDEFVKSEDPMFN